MHTRASLAADLRALGLAPGDVVMAHASVRAVGRVAGGPDEIHLAIADAVGPAGTLLMYAGCPDLVDDVGRVDGAGRPLLTPEQEAEALEQLPPFDPATARSARSHGALVELLRTWPGTRAGNHTTRFVARGARAEALLADPPWDWAFGRGSALDRLVALDGKILLLGSDHDAVTFLHHAEHVGDFPDKRVARFRVPWREGDRRVWREMREVDSSLGAHAHWPERFFALLVDDYLAATGSAGGRVGDAPSFVVSAPGLLAHAVPIMQRVAADPRAADGLRELGRRSSDVGRRTDA